MSAEYEKTRIYAMEQALKNMVGMMQDSGADIRIAMSDFGVEIDIRRAWEKLGEIIGETYTEELIDQLFSQFCLGK